MGSHFLFETGEWLGAGQVSFSVSPDVLYYRTKWNIAHKDDGNWHCTQMVEIVGGDQITNEFVLSTKSPPNFTVLLHNELLGSFEGTGVMEEDVVAWEFKKPGTFEGYEVYERLHETEYTMHAEYLSQEGARTMIRGRIWKRQTPWEENPFPEEEQQQG